MLKSQSLARKNPVHSDGVFPGHMFGGIRTRGLLASRRGLTMQALKSVLRRCGYCLEGGDLRPTPLERVRATKRDLHCGGRAHNCLLSEAKCQTGKNKAKGIY